MLSAFVSRELAQGEQEEIARHLMQCSDCRSEHDVVKFGSALAGSVERHDAPQRVWNEIAAGLDERGTPRMTLVPDVSYFGPRNFATYAAGLILIMAVASVVYLTLFRGAANDARSETPVQNQTEHAAQPDVAVISAETPPTSEQPSALPATANSGGATPETTSIASWEFEAISGAPKVGDTTHAESIAVGQVLETDAASRARIEVADIGTVEIAPNSRVRMVGTSSTQHRLSLERGGLHARISAPPRLFIVDTPSAMAVDLGCEYKLDVDKAGDSRLHVTSGFVALERDGRESIVPAGAICLTRKGKGLGTPFSADTTKEFRRALERFDFSGGGSTAVKSMLATRGFYDMITLWHLVTRVRPSDRVAVFDALAEYVNLPETATREGILRLDKKMLADWREEVERVWFE